MSATGISGINIHMASRSERDVLEFDYRLKPGITTETNAFAIARMAGVPVYANVVTGSDFRAGKRTSAEITSSRNSVPPFLPAKKAKLATMKPNLVR